MFGSPCLQGEPKGGGSTVLTLSCALSAQVSDMLHDGVEVRVEFAGGDTEREDAQLLQVQVALVVLGGALGMGVTVDFDTQARRRAVEVEEVGTDGRLASEVEADLVAAQALPEAFFRLAHLTAHLAGACDTVRLPVAVRHTLSVRYRRRGSCWILPPSVRFPPLREGNRVGRGFGSPCLQGEPAGGGLHLFPPSVRFPPLCEGNREQL
jgi:hypothetical protein